jgi:hypothetical protein
MRPFILLLHTTLLVVSCKDTKTANTDQKPVPGEARPVSSEIVPQSEVKQLFTDSIKREFQLGFRIFRVYKYNDRSGEYFCVLTESTDSISNDKDTFNHSIRAVDIKIEQDKWVKNWELNDNIINQNEENSIWFWTRYALFMDFDGDGLIEPLIVYGTRAMNGYDDCRIKFIIYYKGKKIVIRHQNGILDNERKTSVEDAFYSLPQALKDSVKSKMKVMENEDKAIFTETW